jgi:hypothetical protein
MRTRAIVIVTVLAAASLAAADAPKPFDAQVSAATTLSRVDLAGLGWALTAPCNGGDDLAQRQCRAVRDARVAVVRSSVFVVEGDSAAVSVGRWIPETKSAPVTVHGCIACIAPVGGVYVVASKAAPTWQGTVAQAAALDEVGRPFKDDAAAQKWATHRGSGLRAQFVVRVATATGGVWQHDGKIGLAVDVLGFRVYDPCDGEVIRASAEASQGPIDRAACRDAEANGAAKPGGRAAAKAEPTVRGPALPAQLDAKQIKASMRSVVEAANACFETYGVAGASKLLYTVGGDGSVLAYELTGDFVDTPTGACIDQAARAVTFPKVKKKQFVFGYPLILQ